MDITSISKFLNEAVDDYDSDADQPWKPVEILLPFLKQYGIIVRTTTAADVTIIDLRALAVRWGVKMKDPKTHKERNFDDLLQTLIHHNEATSAIMPGSTKQLLSEAERRGSAGQMALSASIEALPSKKKLRLKNNFMGLPDYAYDANPNALIYQARKVILEKVDPRAHSREEHHHEHKEDKVADGSGEKESKKINASMIAAQRKVSHALLTMVQNESMSIHFMVKGGVEAVMKLLGESTDTEVLTVCLECLLSAAQNPEYCKILTEKYILSTISGMLDKCDQQIGLLVAKFITYMSYQEALGDILVLGGIVGIVQNLFQMAAEYELFFYLMLTMNNVGPCLSGPDAELCLKILMSCTKRLDVARHYENACFAVDIFVNFTRCMSYSIILCEEGALPLFIHSLESYMTKDMMGRISEAYVNLSCTRKNRREISSSGIATHLDKVFNVGTPQMRAWILSMVGNLLTSGFFHDKIARDDAINPMLTDMFDPEQTAQFVAVSYVIAQLAQVETSSVVMVRCNAIQIILGLLREAPIAATNYLWTLLAALSQQPRFFEDMVKERMLVLEMYKEVLDDNSTHIELVVQLAYNLSLRKDLVNFLEQDLIEMFVELLKRIFSFHARPLKATALSTLINFCTYSKTSRATLLGVGTASSRAISNEQGHHIIDLFEDVGIDDAIMNVKYLSILNIISNEDNLCIKMLEAGAQKFMVAVQGSITTMPAGVSAPKKSGPTSGNAVLGQQITGELGRALTAATLHNLSLKRATLGPGVLLTIMAMIRNNKTLRILHSVRTLARCSVHPKSKTSLTREKRLVPALTAIMRSGCEEADRVQHFSAIAICNTLASQVPKEIMQELAETGAITDLVVCTLLRINSIYTKESLGKALFNLMTRVEFRRQMVVTLDVLTAMLELAKIENIELLELCMRTVYNITCETKEYSKKMGELKLPNILIARVTLSPLILGAKATTAVKMLCGMSIANISFDPDLAEDLVFDKKLADACMAIFNLDGDEATYCAAVTLCNLSKLDSAKILADTVAIPLLVKIIARGPVACIQMAVVALCNFSMMPVFYDQLTHIDKEGKGALPSLTSVISAPAMHEKIKLDALQALYNVVTKHEESWVPAVNSEVIAALAKLLKPPGSTDEAHMPNCIRIGRIVKELSFASDNADVLKKLLADGVMAIILKLSKPEQPALKFDMACALYALSRSPDPIKVLQWDGVDVMYWLTAHDCLNMFDPIRRNVCRALRNFSGSGVNNSGAVALAKEERTITVLRALGLSTNEDVLWQVSGAMYNMLGVPESQEQLLNVGGVGMLLDLAASGYTSVRHVCSACLHMCPPDAMPDLSDPAALSLVLCLLEVDGEKFGELAELALDEIPYILDGVWKRSGYEADPTGFTGTWVAIACEVDAVFSPALVAFPMGTYKEVPPQRPGSGTLALSQPHKQLNGTEFFFGGAGVKVVPPEVVSGFKSQNNSVHDDHESHAGTLDEEEDYEDGMGSYAGSDDGPHVPGHSFVPPEQASDIVFPKIFNKQDLPVDTISAIRNSNAKAAKTMEQFPQRLNQESIATNSHMNASMPVDMSRAIAQERKSHK